MAAPFLEFDLARELDQLHCEPQPTSGQNAKTLKTDARIRGHRAEGRISIQTIHGHIRVRALERTFDLPAGRLLALDQGLAHDVGALENSAFLLNARMAWQTPRPASIEAS